MVGVGPQGAEFVRAGWARGAQVHLVQEKGGIGGGDLEDELHRLTRKGAQVELGGLPGTCRRLTGQCKKVDLVYAIQVVDAGRKVVAVSRHSAAGLNEPGQAQGDRGVTGRQADDLGEGCGCGEPGRVAAQPGEPVAAMGFDAGGQARPLG